MRPPDTSTSYRLPVQAPLSPGSSWGAVPASCSCGEAGVGRDGEGRARPRPVLLLFDRVGSKVAVLGRGGPGVARSSLSPSQMPPRAWPLSRGHLPVRSQRLPNPHAGSSVPWLRLEALGEGEKGSMPCPPCRPALFSSAHPRKTEHGRGEGGPSPKRLPGAVCWLPGPCPPAPLAPRHRLSRQVSPPPFPTGARDTSCAPEPAWDPACVHWVGITRPCRLGQDPRACPGCCGGQLQKS